MARSRSWYASLHGRFISGEWTGEIAQVGIRGTAADSGGFFTPVISAPLGEYEVVPDGDVESDADFDIAYGFRGVNVLTKTHQRAIAALLRTFADAVKTLQPATKWRWDEVRVAALDANHKYINGASIFTLKSPIVGTGGTTLAPQAAVVASVRSGGRKTQHRGRMYVPAAGITMSTDGIVGPTSRTTVSNAAAALFRNLDLVDANIYPGVVSLTHNEWSSAINIIVNDMLDTQRRRAQDRKPVETTVAV